MQPQFKALKENFARHEKGDTFLVVDHQCVGHKYALEMNVKHPLPWIGHRAITVPDHLLEEITTSEKDVMKFFYDCHKNHVDELIAESTIYHPTQDPKKSKM